jgi:hypothetical protein
MDRTWLYKSRVIKADIPKENKDDLRKRLGTEVTAYINSGGQIQHCTPCAYTESEKQTLGPSHKRTLSRMSEKFYT